MKETSRNNDDSSDHRLRKTVRVGIALASPSLPAWEYSSLQRILSTEGVTPVFVLFLPQAERKEPSVGMVANWYLALDSKRISSSNDPLRRKDATDLIAGIPTVSLDTFTGGSTDRPEADVIIQLGPAEPRASLAASSRNGLWYHPESSTGLATGFDAMMGGSEVVTSSVQAILPSGGTVTLRASHGSASDSSPGRIRGQVLWKSVSLLSRELSDLTRQDASLTGKKATGNDQNRRKQKGTSFGFIRHLGSQVTTRISRKLFLDQWHLLYHLDPAGGPAPDDPRLFSPIIPPKNRFWADPFVISEHGRYYLFIEESLMKPHKKGFISVIIMDRDGRWEQPVKVIEQPYHLSYPFMFRYEGELFMIPESGQNKTVDLYRCEEFPFRWKHHHVIMDDVRAVDTTLLFHEDRWWMFTTMIETEGASLWDELYLFWSDNPVRGPWTPHPRNPVLSDARRARPAGAVQSTDGKLYRPSQDCGRRYGYALNMNEILALNTRDYQEQVVRRVEPPSGSPIKAIHTLNSAGGLTVMDGILRRRRFP